MGVISFVMGYVAPVFLIVSPLTSYADQIYSIHRTRSSTGFSLDIPLIMLVASLLKVFYWFGARFDASLLIQACIMIGVQIVLLKVALEHRPPPSIKGGIEGMPFVGAREGEMGVKRPWNFWQWRSPRPYWEFLTWFSATLIALQLLIGAMPQYQALIGYLGLAIEATLPIPQMLANHRAKSCKGFRFSVLANWLLGDVMKMGFFFFSDGAKVPWAFKLCGLFQFVCDIYLGGQYWRFGEGGGAGSLEEGKWRMNGLNDVR
ncbi:MAG: hypothetical protein M1830_009982 [Pleopsidium flavum]|nr:MAG: hypothetical protein M1830_009982 [Pleopsidium flavum]